MKDSGGIITGSTILQMLIGEKKFKANDLDVFMCFEPKYSSLHRLCYFLSTGLESIPGGTPRDELEEKQQLIIREKIKTVGKEMIGTEMPFEFLSRTYACGTTVVFPQHISIRRIRNYSIMKSDGIAHKIQLIEVGARDERKGISLLEQYISQFDFRCCTSRYDGTRCILQSLHDVLSRKLVLTQGYRMRTPFLTDYAQTAHLKRIKKYVERGFSVASCESKSKKRKIHIEMQTKTQETVDFWLGMDPDDVRMKYEHQFTCLLNEHWPNKRCEACLKDLKDDHESTNRISKEAFLQHLEQYALCAFCAPTKKKKKIKSREFILERSQNSSACLFDVEKNKVSLSFFCCF